MLSNPQCNGIWRWEFWRQLGHEDEALINGISALVKRYRGDLLDLFLFPSLGREYPLEKGMATHSSIHAWRIPWTEDPGGLQSMRSQRVGMTKRLTLTFFFCRVRTQQEARKRGLTRHRTSQHLDLGLPSLQNQRCKCLLSKPPGL